MSETVKQMSKKAGLPPGSAIHVGHRKIDKLNMSVMDYNEESFINIDCKKLEELYPYKDKETVTWINVVGLHDTEKISAIGEYFGLDALSVEDILNTSHRPSYEEFEKNIFLSFKMLSIDEIENSVITEQISFILNKNTLLSFREQEDNIFKAISQRIGEGRGVIRTKKTDYLFYRLIDTVVDNYFLVTEHISNLSENLEERVLTKPDEAVLVEIQQLKRQVIMMRKAVSPLKEAILLLQKDANPIITDGTRRYLRDVYEHLVQLNDTIETERDIVANIMELHLSGVSNRMNQVMKVLTIISTIFIPLTFLAGVYGMNFKYMPELEWRYGYLGAWALMIVIFILLIYYFKRRKWL